MDLYPCGTVVKDNEGKRWIMLVSNGARRWERIIDKFTSCCIPGCMASSENYQVYEIHDNGGRPFDVIVTVDKIFIIGNNDQEREPQYLMTIKEYLKVFIGEDSGISGSEGNSILVQTKEGTYIYIGSEIYSFRTESPILEYYSRIGNNDVPYPYAVTKNEVYLMIEPVILNRYGLILYSTQEGMIDMPGEPYQEYYDKKSIGRPFQYQVLQGRSQSVASLINVWSAATAPYRT